MPACCLAKLPAQDLIILMLLLPVNWFFFSKQAGMRGGRSAAQKDLSAAYSSISLTVSYFKQLTAVCSSVSGVALPTLAVCTSSLYT